LPPGPDEPWDPFNLLSTQYCKLLPQRWSGQGMKLTTHLHLMPRLRIHGIILYSPICNTCIR
jgi:hypothetical protein